MNQDVTVYTQPSCPQCDATKRKLNRLGVPYTTVDLTADPAARDMVLSRGFRTAPVVNAGQEWWSGFRPDLIANLTRIPAAA